MRTTIVDQREIDRTAISMRNNTRKQMKELFGKKDIAHQIHHRMQHLHVCTITSKISDQEDAKAQLKLKEIRPSTECLRKMHHTTNMKEVRKMISTSKQK
jgi:hypothetical protein